MKKDNDVIKAISGAVGLASLMLGLFSVFMWSNMESLEMLYK